MKTYVKLTGLMLLLLLAALFGLAWIFAQQSRSPRLRVENFPQVQMGMAQEQVEALLGGPPGKYLGYPIPTKATFRESMTAEGYSGPIGSTQKIWSNHNKRFEIWFDKTDHVVGIHERFQFSESGYTDSFLEYCCSHLKRPFGR